jgi:predicted ferric reductase
MDGDYRLAHYLILVLTLLTPSTLLTLLTNDSLTSHVISWRLSALALLWVATIIRSSSRVYIVR